MHFKHSKIISDLVELIRLLKKYKFDDSNIMELYRIENIIGLSQKQNNNINLTYDFNGIVFNISNSGMKAKPTPKAISVIIDSKYVLKETMNATNDIFSSYEFQLYIKGYTDENDKDKFNFFCWHLDREPYTDGNLIHPYYHFHAGGKKIGDYKCGDLFMISSPRIPHPPMDIFLAIHFVILNFFHSKDFIEQRKILEDDNYILIIERAQKRVLDPYFATFNGTSHADYSVKNLFPLYV